MRAFYPAVGGHHRRWVSGLGAVVPNYDEHLTEWVVKPGDPAAKAVSTLHRRGIEVVVLPRVLYLGGTAETQPPMPEADDKQLVFRLRAIECMSLLGGAASIT